MLSLKKLRNALRQELTMREFFTSPVFSKNFEDVSKMVSARYKTPIFVSLRWDTNKEDVAYTDNRKIYINLDNCLVRGIDNFEDRYLAYLGLLGHELGHVLYTDFNDVVNWRKSLLNGKIYGRYNSIYQKNVEDLLDYMKKNHFYGYVFEIFDSISNSIEDRYVNEEICKEFPGTFNTGIKKLHKIQYAKPTELLMNPITDFLNAVLKISILGKIPDGFEKVYPQLENIKKILKNIPENKSSDRRLNLSNDVFLEYWPVIKMYAELHKDEAQNAKCEGEGDGSPSQGNNSSSSSASKATKSSQVGRGTGIKCSKENSNKNDSKSSKDNNSQGKNNHDDKNNSSEDDKQNKNSGSGNENSDKNQDCQEGLGSEKDNNMNNSEKENSESYDDKDQNENSEDNGGLDDECNSDNKDEAKSDSSQNEGSSDDGSRDGDGQNDDSSTDCSDDSSSSDSDRQGQEVSADITFGGDVCNEKIDIDNIEKIIDGLISKMAKGMVNKNPERAERILANTQAQEIVNDKKSCHNGYKLTINTVSNSNDRIKYESAARRLSGISRRLQKRVLDILDEQNDGGVCKNLLKGNKINPAASASNNGRIFKRNMLPDRPELAVCVLIDQSGSMCGQRIEKALEMAIIIEDFCSALEIPVQISGHCDSCGCQIYDYIRFDDYNKNRKYRLTKMFSSGCNRDGLALKYCENNILEREENNKLLIIISDGRPNSDGYYGSVAEKDLKEIKRHFEKNGGRLIAAAIGDDKYTIKRIYQDSFMDITDLSQLPIKMIKVISSYFT